MDFISSVVAGTVAVVSNIGMEAEVGVNRYDIQPDGTWYQKAFPHEIKKTSTMFSIGLNGPLGDTLQWHAGYVNLGRIHSDAMVTDEIGSHRYNPFSKNGCSHGRCKMVRAVGDGYTHGLMLSVDNDRKDHKGFVAGAGMFIGKSKWKVHALTERADWQMEHKAPLSVAPMVRFGYAFGNGSTVSYMYIHHNSDRDFSALQRGSHVVSYRYQF